MARKFGRNRRFVPSTERALFKNEHLTGRHIDRTDLIDAIRGGEDSYLEFKVRFSNPDKLAAGICALANSGGGTIAATEGSDVNLPLGTILRIRIDQPIEVIVVK